MPTVAEAPRLDDLFDVRDPHSLEQAIKHLDGLGHVALTNVFPPEMLVSASDQDQLDEQFPIVSWRNHDGQEVAIRTGLQLPEDDKGLGNIRGAIFQQLADLGRATDPTHTQHFDRLAVLAQGHSSLPQRLRETQGPTMAITTLRGDALLAIDHPVLGRAHHPLVPGVVSLIHGHELSFRESAKGSTNWLGYFATMQVPNKPF
jgi:hypothetical protein